MTLTSELTPDAVVRGMTGRITPHPSERDRSEAFLPSPCIQNHAANLALLPDGALACVWFGGTMEGMGDISVWLSRLEPGSDRWTEPRRLSNEAGRSEQNPVLFTAPDGEVWLFYTSQPGGRQDAALVMHRRSRDGGASFEQARPLCESPGTFVRQPPVVTAAGDWLLPAFRCVGRPGAAWTGDEDTAALLVSRDGGATWTLRDVPDSVGAVHMNIVPASGDTLIALFRDRYAEHVRRGVSRDGGATWSPPAPTSEPNNNSSIQAIRLGDGRIAMVYNPSNAASSSERRASLYDEIEGEPAAAAPTPGIRAAIWGARAPLSLAFSDDDGASFSGRRDFETGSGYCLSNNSRDGTNRELSYPSILETADGVVHIAFTYHRRAIKYLRLDPGP